VLISQQLSGKRGEAPGLQGGGDRAEGTEKKAMDQAWKKDIKSLQHLLSSTIKRNQKSTLA